MGKCKGKNRYRNECGITLPDHIEYCRYHIDQDPEYQNRNFLLKRIYKIKYWWKTKNKKDVVRKNWMTLVGLVVGLAGIAVAIAIYKIGPSLKNQEKIYEEQRVQRHFLTRSYLTEFDRKYPLGFVAFIIKDDYKIEIPNQENSEPIGSVNWETASIDRVKTNRSKIWIRIPDVDFGRSGTLSGITLSIERFPGANRCGAMMIQGMITCVEYVLKEKDGEVCIFGLKRM